MTNIGQWLATNADLPRIECELLLSEALDVNRAHLLAYPENELSEDVHDLVNQQIHDLRQGRPLAYILGEREFWGLPFKVTSDVLIPRPETELLVELALAHTPPDGRVLDLGTGSGAIAISVGHDRADLDVTATDTSTAALEIARQNATHHNVSLTLIHSAWFTSLKGHWDVIVSNPPYIAPNDPHLPALNHEPESALVAAQDGLADIANIIAHSADFLQPGGLLIIEHGYDQAQRVRTLFAAAGFHDIRSARDLANIERATLGYRS